MEETKKVGRPPKQDEAPTQRFNPASLPKEDIEAVVEFYLGLHPKYFVYQTTENGPIIVVDGHKIMMQGVPFRMFKPHAEELGIEI